MSFDPFARKSQTENKKWTYLQANFSILIADETKWKGIIHAALLYVYYTQFKPLNCHILYLKSTFTYCYQTHHHEKYNYTTLLILAHYYYCSTTL